MTIRNSLYYQSYKSLEAKKVSFADFAKNKNYYNQLSFLYERACSRNPHTKKEVDFVERTAKLFCDTTRPSFLDVACGTGRHDRILSNRGYTVTGIDNSGALLKVARQKDKKTVYKKCDMREFRLNKKFDCIFSLWEAYNYLSRPQDIKAFFQHCQSHLSPKGILILDCRNFWRQEVPKKRVQQRSFQVDGHNVDLIMRKQTFLRDRVHEGIFMYFLARKDGSENVVIDQELVRIFSVKDLQRIAGSRFHLIKKYGDFDRNKVYHPATPERMIVVFQKA